MRLERLAAASFRNLGPLEVHTGARFVVVSGENAQGKTNALEAVWFLASLRPLHGRRAAELVAWGSKAATVAGDVRDEGLRRYKLVLSPRGRRLQVDGVKTDQASWFEGLRAIAFTPSHARIVTDTPSGRRQWVDRAAFTASPVHLEVARAYRRLVDQKSAALRAPDAAVLDVLDAHLSQHGAELVARREEILHELVPHVQQLHAEISGRDEAVGLRYVTEAQGVDRPARAARLAEVLERSRVEEVRRGHCLVGPQRDEVIIELDGKPARTYASRGQVRSLVLAMKLAELVAARARGESPLFLLDDLSSELDRERTRRLVEVLCRLGVQVFLTTTDPAHIEGLPREDTTRLRVVAGAVEALS